MARQLDVLFINPDSSAKAYQGLAQVYSAVEPPTWPNPAAPKASASPFSTAMPRS